MQERGTPRQQELLNVIGEAMDRAVKSVDRRKHRGQNIDLLKYCLSLAMLAYVFYLGFLILSKGIEKGSEANPVMIAFIGIIIGALGTLTAFLVRGRKNRLR